MKCALWIKLCGAVKKEIPGFIFEEMNSVGFPTKTSIFLICFEQKGLEEQTQINKTILSHVKLCNNPVGNQKQDS